MEHDDDQARAIREAREWLADPRPQPQVRYLAGAAGTGKTTIAREITDGYTVSFLAPTGKAAGVLRRKGCEGAATIHSTIYKPLEVPPGAPPEFELRGQDPFDADDPDPFDGADGIVCDECSMVDDDVWRDLLSFRRKILVIGDPYQLPPVKPSVCGPSSLSPTWLLKRVHRQALESGVLRLATDVREGRAIDRSPGAYGDDVALVGYNDVDMLRVIEHCDQTLVWKNATRHAWNGWVREERARAIGRPVARLPIAGDRLVCLRNDKRRGLANGEVWEVTEVGRGENGELHLDLADEGSAAVGATTLRDVPVWAEHFLGEEQALSQMSWRVRRQRCEFDYAYALTVHKSQGSEWPSVCVLNENKGSDAGRWLYTAVTRSSRELLVLE